jgi:hypothetical protein
VAAAEMASRFTEARVWEARGGGKARFELAWAGAGGDRVRCGRKKRGEKLMENDMWDLHSSHLTNSLAPLSVRVALNPGRDYFFPGVANSSRV